MELQNIRITGLSAAKTSESVADKGKVVPVLKELSITP
jgi:hypothetical protein